jgi:hypothetical protein
MDGHWRYFSTEPDKFYGRTICGASIENDELVLVLDGPEKIAIFDGGQSCCESRYMSTDDELSSLIGHTLTRIEAKSGPDMNGGEVHETCFLEIGTDQNFVTIVNHNEHNGYYGGFSLAIMELGERDD